jgi:hypothetical protein
MLFIKGHGGVGLGPAAHTQVPSNDPRFIDADLSKRWSCTCSKAHQCHTNLSHAALPTFMAEIGSRPLADAGGGSMSPLVSLLQGGTKATAPLKP